MSWIVELGMMWTLGYSTSLKKSPIINLSKTIVNDSEPSMYRKNQTRYIRNEIRWFVQHGYIISRKKLNLLENKRISTCVQSREHCNANDAITKWGKKYVRMGVESKMLHFSVSLFWKYIFNFVKPMCDYDKF